MAQVEQKSGSQVKLWFVIIMAILVIYWVSALTFADASNARDHPSYTEGGWYQESTKVEAFATWIPLACIAIPLVVLVSVLARRMR